MARDPEVTRRIDELHDRLEKDEITVREYNEGRQAILKEAAAAHQEDEETAAAEPAQKPDEEAALEAKKDAALSALAELLDAEKITMREYNARRQAIVSGEAPPEIELSPEPTEPAKPAEPAKPVEPGVPPASADRGSTEQGAQSTGPAGWGQKEARGPKRWSAGARADDPSVRKVHAPLASGIGDGKVFCFLFGFRKASPKDQKMLEMELKEIDDDIEVLRKAGYTVVVDPQGTHEDFQGVVTGKVEGAEGLAPAGFYWSAHGHPDGSIDCCDGAKVTPSDIDPELVPSTLRLAVLGACYVGSRAKSWRRALGGHPLVVGWGRPVTIQRAVDFLSTREDTDNDLDDLIARYLLADTPVPREDGTGDAMVGRRRGRVGDLPERIERIAGLLGAKWREQENAVEVYVPLPNGRSQIVDVFIVDSAEPFNEGEPLLGVESDVGELTAIADAQTLLGFTTAPGYVRLSLAHSTTDAPRIVGQGFLPMARVRERDLAALIYHVAATADALENRLFGVDEQ